MDKKKTVEDIIDYLMDYVITNDNSVGLDIGLLSFDYLNEDKVTCNAVMPFVLEKIELDRLMDVKSGYCFPNQLTREIVSEGGYLKHLKKLRNAQKLKARADRARDKKAIITYWLWWLPLIISIISLIHSLLHNHR